MTCNIIAESLILKFSGGREGKRKSDRKKDRK